MTELWSLHLVRGIMALSLVLVLSACADEIAGRAPVTLSHSVQEGLAEYQALSDPGVFALSEDGEAFAYDHSPSGWSWGGDETPVIEACQLSALGRPCWIYARGGDVVWRGTVRREEKKDRAEPFVSALARDWCDIWPLSQMEGGLAACLSVAERDHANCARHPTYPDCRAKLMVRRAKAIPTPLTSDQGLCAFPGLAQTYLTDRAACRGFGGEVVAAYLPLDVRWDGGVPYPGQFDLVHGKRDGALWVSAPDAAEGCIGSYRFSGAYETPRAAGTWVLACGETRSLRGLFVRNPITGRIEGRGKDDLGMVYFLTSQQDRGNP